MAALVTLPGRTPRLRYARMAPLICASLDRTTSPGAGPTSIALRLRCQSAHTTLSVGLAPRSADYTLRG